MSEERQAAEYVRHLEVEPHGSWDTKVRCYCGAEFVSRCEMWKHQADAYVLLIDGPEEA